MDITQQCVKEDITKEIIKYFEMNENKSATYLNLQEAVKAMLTGKFIVTNAYIKNVERSQIPNQTLQLK